MWIATFSRTQHYPARQGRKWGAHQEPAVSAEVLQTFLGWRCNYPSWNSARKSARKTQPQFINPDLYATQLNISFHITPGLVSFTRLVGANSGVWCLLLSSLWDRVEQAPKKAAPLFWQAFFPAWSVDKRWMSVSFSVILFKIFFLLSASSLLFGMVVSKYRLRKVSLFVM